MEDIHHCNYVNDQDAFLFVIQYKNKKRDNTETRIKTPLLIEPQPEREQWSVFQGKSHGPSFGAGPDFQLNSHGHGVANCMPWSYNYGNDLKQVALPRFMHGNQQFQYLDYEVIQITIE